MIFKEKIEEYIKEKAIVEIATKQDYSITGILKFLGDDFIIISHSVEREITVRSTTGEKKTQIEVLELETNLLLEDVRAVSKIVKKVIK